jgi:hypothetical protein
MWGQEYRTSSADRRGDRRLLQRTRGRASPCAQTSWTRQRPSLAHGRQRRGADDGERKGDGGAAVVLAGRTDGEGGAVRTDAVG